MQILDLKDGRQIPTLGLGFMFAEKSKVVETVIAGIKAGFRHIDTAQVYGNEELIGQGIAKAIELKLVTREELFVSGKLWNLHHDPDIVGEKVEETLKKLGLKYLDLLIIHFPTAFLNTVKSQVSFESKEKFLTYPLEDTWEEMENLVRLNKVISLGLANFNKKQIMRIIERCEIEPAVLQIESSVLFPNQDLIDFCKTQNIIAFSWLPFGHPDHEDSKNLFFRKEIVKIADDMKKTAPQVCLKHCLQRGLGVIVDSTDPNKLQEYGEVFDFDIDIDDMFEISNKIIPKRTADFVELLWGHAQYPFEDVKVTE